MCVCVRRISWLWREDTVWAFMYQYDEHRGLCTFVCGQALAVYRRQDRGRMCPIRGAWGRAKLVNLSGDSRSALIN